MIGYLGCRMCMTSLRRSPWYNCVLNNRINDRGWTGSTAKPDGGHRPHHGSCYENLRHEMEMPWNGGGGGRKSLTRPSSYPAPSPSAVTHITVCNSTAHIDGEEGRCQNGGRLNGVFVLEPRLPSPLEQSVCPGWTRNRVYLGLYLVDCKWLSLHLRLVHCTRNAIRAA
ncbi:hypothetical protein NLU13_6098 [Sarocladium strictum]|uniref:Uncharacterized protein n=1 Tax=Sarocladium strictum TaxID=5046 RepID=A0AA39GFV6_SARSR|nr:hypothetical protein NLU13_6098 [Sarocladium strictum]